jgi:alpha-ketoglutarate-dependent taurine dioxygenase
VADHADPTDPMARKDCPYRSEGELPLQLRPRVGDPSARDVGALCKWLEEHADWVQERITAHGALRFRGFDVRDAHDFERIARAVDDELKTEYLGTSPRDAITDHVFSASELPAFYPIPQHCEMSFTATPPRRVFFCCLVPPAPGSGETPLCDFRRVWSDLDPVLRDRFVQGGLRIVRNYSGPDGGGRLDLWKLKRWDEMFLTSDRAVVEEKCREQGFEAIWTGNQGLRLVSTQPVYRDHPVTGERVWHNHSTTFHVSQAEGEYRRIAELRPTLRNHLLLGLARALTALQRRRPPDGRSLHCTRLDGREIPEEDMEAVRDVVWQNMVIEPWRRGDVVAIDNHSVSHGRLPYSGPRQIAVCWA